MSVSLKIKFKSRSVDDFIARYGVDVSKGGIFIRTTKPLAVGTSLTFEFQLQDGGALLKGRGTVAWVRDKDGADTGAPGMGIRFDKLPAESAKIVDRIVQRKQTPDAGDKASGKGADTPESTSDDDEITLGGALGDLEDGHDVFGEGPPSATEINLPSPELLLKSRTSGDKSESDDADDAFGDERRDASLEIPSAASSDGTVRTREIEQDAKEKVDADGPDTPDEGGTPAETDEEKRQRRLEKILFSDAESDAPSTEDVADLKTGSQPIQTAPPQQGAPRRRPTSAVKPVRRPQAPAGNNMLIAIVVLILAGVGIWYAFGGDKTTEKPTPTGTATPTMHSGKSTPPRTAQKPANVVQTPPPKVDADVPATIRPDATTGTTVATVVADSGPSPTVDAAAVPVPDQAPSKPALVSLLIESKPPGAKLSVDGSPLNQVTPFTLTNLDPEKSIEILFDLSGKRLVRVSTKPNGEKPLKVVLRKSSKRIVRFTSTPAGARVSLNGKRLGKTPLDYKRRINARRSYRLRYALSGFEIFDKTLKGEQDWKRQGEEEVWVIDATLVERPPTPPPSTTEGKKTAVAKKVRPRRIKRPVKPKTEKPRTEKPKTEKPKTEKPKTEKPKTAVPKAPPKTPTKAPAKKPGIKLPSWGE